MLFYKNDPIPNDPIPNDPIPNKIDNQINWGLEIGKLEIYDKNTNIY
jgi:hypothetical protein